MITEEKPSTLHFLEASQKVIQRAEAALNVKYDPPDIPYEESVTTAEVPEAIPELANGFRCRSFRADFMHKTRVIISAFGGSIEKAAYEMKINHRTFRGWVDMDHVPTSRAMFDKLDRYYDLAIEKLKFLHAQKAAKKKSRRRK